MKLLAGEQRSVNYFKNLNTGKDRFVCEVVYIVGSEKTRAVYTTDNIKELVQYLERQKEVEKWLYLNLYYRFVATTFEVLEFGQIASYTPRHRPTGRTANIEDIKRYMKTIPPKSLVFQNIAKVTKMYLYCELHDSDYQSDTELLDMLKGFE